MPDNFSFVGAAKLYTLIPLSTLGYSLHLMYPFSSKPYTARRQRKVMVILLQLGFVV